MAPAQLRGQARKPPPEPLQTAAIRILLAMRYAPSQMPKIKEFG